MKEIPLTRGMTALISDHRFDEISKYKWYAHAGYNANSWYAARGMFNNDGSHSIMLMHAQIMGTKPGLEIDHIDTCGLNNQDCNLRFCTSSQNKMNTNKRKDCSSTHKGVYWDTQTNKWKVRIKLNGKNKYLGYFNDENEAGTAYNEAAQIYYGEFARLNAI